MIISNLFYCAILLHIFNLINGQEPACEPKDSWSWTPWFNFHRPSVKGEYELHAAIRSRHPTIVCAEPRAVSAVNQAGIDMNRTLDMILVRGYDVFCLNSYDPKFQKKVCDDYSVRYCCPTLRSTSFIPTVTHPVTWTTTFSTLVNTFKFEQFRTTRTTTPSTIVNTFKFEPFHTTRITTPIPIHPTEQPSRIVQFSCGREMSTGFLQNRVRTNFFTNFFRTVISKIINGAESKPNNWPWAVSIGISYRSSTGLWQNRTHICGGTLVDQSYVLTAAHCLEQKIDDRFVPFTSTNPSLESFFVLRIGIHDIRTTRSEQIYRAGRIFVHERFVANTFENDIALIRLERPVTLNEHTVPICLPSNHVAPGIQVTVAGWGTIAETSRVHSDVLRQATVNVLAGANCRVYTDVHFDTAKQLCAASSDWSKDTWFVLNNVHIII